MKRWISRLPGESEGLESGASNGKGLEKALGLRAYTKHIRYGFENDRI